MTMVVRLYFFFNRMSFIMKLPAVAPFSESLQMKVILSTTKNLVPALAASSTESRISCSRSEPMMSSGSISARWKFCGKTWISPVAVSVYRIWNCLQESSRSRYRIFSVRAMFSAIWIARMDLPTLLEAKMTVFSYWTMSPWKKVLGSGVLSESSIQSLAGLTERRPTFFGARLVFSTSWRMSSIGDGD